MSLVVVVPDLVQTAAQDLAGIRSSLAEVTEAIAAPTTSLAPSAQDEISNAVAALLRNFGAEYQALDAQAAAFHDMFVNTLSGGAGAYVAAEAANGAALFDVGGGSGLLQAELSLVGDVDQAILNFDLGVLNFGLTLGLQGPFGLTGLINTSLALANAFGGGLRSLLQAELSFAGELGQALFGLVPFGFGGLGGLLQAELTLASNLGRALFGRGPFGFGGLTGLIDTGVSLANAFGGGFGSLLQAELSFAGQRVQALLNFDLGALNFGLNLALQGPFGLTGLINTSLALANAFGGAFGLLQAELTLAGDIGRALLGLGPLDMTLLSAFGGGFGSLLQAELTLAGDLGQALFGLGPFGFGGLTGLIDTSLALANAFGGGFGSLLQAELSFAGQLGQGLLNLDLGSLNLALSLGLQGPFSLTGLIDTSLALANAFGGGIGSLLQTEATLAGELGRALFGLSPLDVTLILQGPFGSLIGELTI